jgi:hypothetical protein
VLDHPVDDPLVPGFLSATLDQAVPHAAGEQLASPVVPSESRTNLMAGDLVEINRATVNGRAWMSTVAPVKHLFERGVRAELLSDPVRSEGQIWVKLRLPGDVSADACFVVARYLDLVEARSDAPLTVIRPPSEREADRTPYHRDDIVHTTVAVNLRAAPGAQGPILRKLPSNTLGTVRTGVEQVGATEWMQVALPDITGWVAARHTKLFARHEKWIEVDLSAQTLSAWNDRAEDARLKISSGKPGFRTPAGVFTISSKYPARRTVATVKGEHWNIPGVPWIMVFRTGGYYFHGVYWHNDFGRPVSHGCVTLGVPDAEWLYDWTPPGAPVWIHD